MPNSGSSPKPGPFKELVSESAKDTQESSDFGSVFHAGVSSLQTCRFDSKWKLLLGTRFTILLFVQSVLKFPSLNVPWVYRIPAA